MIVLFVLLLGLLAGLGFVALILWLGDRNGTR